MLLFFCGVYLMPSFCCHVVLLSFDLLRRGDPLFGVQLHRKLVRGFWALAGSFRKKPAKHRYSIKL